MIKLFGGLVDKFLYVGVSQDYKQNHSSSRQNTEKKMGIASLVIGIIGVILSFIPCVGMLAFIPVVVGLVLGIVDVVTKSQQNVPKGMGITGIILNSIALIIIIAWTAFFGVAASSSSGEIEKKFKEIEQQLEQAQQLQKR